MGREQFLSGDGGLCLALAPRSGDGQMWSGNYSHKAALAR